MKRNLSFGWLYFSVLTAALLGPHYLSELSWAVEKSGGVSSRKPHPRDAYTMQEGLKNNEGEVAHNIILPPDGSNFTSILVQNDTGEEVAAFLTSGAKLSNPTHVYVIIHGRFRDGGKYWEILNDIIKQMRREWFASAYSNSVVVAPQFFSERYNSGQYTSKQLAWGDVNAWQAGEQATHPAGTSLTSIDALDGILTQFSDRNKYPKVTNITVVGHGGGGQLVQRYAAVSSFAAHHIHVRYIHGDPSSCAYFTDDRPVASDSSLSKNSCELYNTWRYGFHNFSGTAHGLKSSKEYFRQYISRDVVSLVGFQDTEEKGDQTCMARIQGGGKRRDRNLIWYRYINELARTNKTLVGLPGEFSSVQDWSDVSGHEIGLRLAVIPNATHDAWHVLQSSVGRSALFSRIVTTVADNVMHF